MNSKKPLTRLLFSLVIGVWGLVAYQVYGTLSSSTDEPGRIDTVEPAGAVQHAPYFYKADVRDPFHFGPSGLSDSSHARAPRAPKLVWVPPPLQLKGILSDQGRKRTAVLEKADGSVFFLAEGDTLLGAKILKVGSGEVSYVFNKKKGAWALEGQ